MSFNSFLIKDSSGEKSVTMTAFVFGFIIVNLKLILSGVTIGGYSMSVFTGSEYALCLSALSGTYILRRAVNKNKEEKETEV